MPRFWGIHHATGIEKFHSLNCLLLFRFDSKRLVFVKEQEHSNQTCCSTHLEVKTFVKTPLVNESGHFFSFKKKKSPGLFLRLRTLNQGLGWRFIITRTENPAPIGRVLVVRVRYSYVNKSPSLRLTHTEVCVLSCLWANRVFLSLYQCAECHTPVTH